MTAGRHRSGNRHERGQGSLGRRRLALGALALALLGTACAEQNETPPQPAGSIVLVVVDTLRRDALGTYGSRTGASSTTPNLDAIAARGAAHPDFRASFHQTSMSMGALFTGHTPSIETGELRRPLPWNGRTWCGLQRFRETEAGEAEGCIPEQIRTLGEVVHAAGYHTAAVVTNELLFRPAGFDRGFDVWRELAPESEADPGDRHAAAHAEAVNEAAAELLRERSSDRLFLYIHYMDVHDYMLRRRPYKRMVGVVDAAIGDLLRMLEDEGLAEGSVIIVASDHGETLTERHLIQGGPGHMGNPSAEEVLRLPLVVSQSGLFDAGRPLRSQDLFALIARLAGGRESTPSELEDDELYLSELHFQTYRKGRWKSIRRRGKGTVHLFDLESDPGEQRDAAAGHPEIVREHVQRIEQLSRSLGASGRLPTALSEEDARRLRSLGYMQ